MTEYVGFTRDEAMYMPQGEIRGVIVDEIGKRCGSPPDVHPRLLEGIETAARLLAGHYGYAKRTPRTWGENELPTAEQLADLMEACTREERVEIAAMAITNGDAATACFIQNHVARIGALEEQARYFTDAAWLTENTLSWTLEMDPHATLYEGRETYLRERLDEEATVQAVLGHAESAGHLWEIRCYPETPVGFLIAYGGTAADAVRIMRTVVEAD